MVARHAVVYYAWSRPDEIGAPPAIIEDRFPNLFESRRMLYPRLQELAAAGRADQGIAGFLDLVLRKNFTAFVEQTGELTGRPVPERERVADDGTRILLDDVVRDGADTIVVISFDSLRTGQRATDAEVRAARAFLAEPGNLLVVSPHHDIGARDDRGADPGEDAREAEFCHHGDRTIPPRQGFGGFARSLLAGLGVPVVNRFGLRPAAAPDGSPAPIDRTAAAAAAGYLDGVTTFNLHPHLPNLERLAEATAKLDVLARQHIDTSAPPHPFTAAGRTTFDAVLASRPGVFAGGLLVTDATLWSSTAGGVGSLRRLWRNVIEREPTRERVAHAQV